MEPEAINGLDVKDLITIFPGQFYIWDIQKNHVSYESKGTAAYLGYSVDAKANRLSDFYTSITHPDDITPYHAFRDALAKSEDDEIHELVVRMKDASGIWHWMSFKERVLRRDEANRPISLLGVTQDITTARRMEEKLRNSNEQLNLLLGQRTAQLLEMTQKMSTGNAEHKRTTRELICNQQILQSMIDFPGNAICVLDLEGNVYLINKAAAKLLKADVDELNGRNIDEFLPEIEAVSTRTRIKNISTSKRPEIRTLPLHDVTIECHYFPIFDEFNEVSLIGLSIPVGQEEKGTLSTEQIETEQREFLLNRSEEIQQAYNALARSDPRYRTIIESPTIYACRFLPNGTFLYVNPAICELMKTTAQELQKKSVFEYMVADEKQELEHFVEHAQPENPYLISDQRMYLPNGKKLWSHWVNKAIFDANGILQEVQSTGWDITKLKENEENVKQLLDVLETTTDVVGAFDNEFNILYINHTGRKFFGIPDGAELSMLDLRHFFPKWVVDYYANWILPAVVRTGSWVGETVVYNQAKEEIPITQVIIAHRDEEGKVVRFSGSFRDIKKVKSQHRRFSERDMQLHDQQAKAIVHELHDRIGQNLTALNLNLTLLEKKLDGKIDRSLTDRLGDSIELVSQTMASVRDIMGELRPPELDDYGLFGLLRSSARTFSKRTGIKVEVTGEESQPKISVEHAREVYQMVQEALTNVAKHAQASAVTVSMKTHNDKVLISVVDDGIGFDPKVVPYEHEREGWGIPGMYWRAEMIGATLHIHSKPGEGTRVDIETELEK